MTVTQFTESTRCGSRSVNSVTKDASATTTKETPR